MLETVTHALKGKKKAAPKPLKKMHIKELDSGGYHVTKSQGDMSTQHAAPDVGALAGLLQEHFGQ